MKTNELKETTCENCVCISFTKEEIKILKEIVKGIKDETNNQT